MNLRLPEPFVPVLTFTSGDVSITITDEQWGDLEGIMHQVDKECSRRRTYKPRKIECSKCGRTMTAHWDRGSIAYQCFVCHPLEKNLRCDLCCHEAAALPGEGCKAHYRCSGAMR